MSDIDYRSEVAYWTKVAGVRWIDIRTAPELYYMYDMDFLTEHLPSMGLANYWERKVATMPVTSNLQYMTFMHEIGHIVSGHGDFNPFSGKEKLRKENEAWTWAFDHMKEPPTPESLAKARDAFKSYMDNHPGAYQFIKDEIHPWLVNA